MINWKEVLEIIITNFCVFFLLLALTRFMGKKQLSQLTFFNYIAGITIGSIASDIVNVNLLETYDDYISLICWAVLTILVGVISLKVHFFRALIDGQPTVVIKKGKIQKKALKSLSVSINDLLMLLRVKDIFNITDVNYAILESNGELAVLKNDSSKSITKKDMGIKQQDEKFITTEIIVDGVLVVKNLKELNIKEAWIKKQLKKQGINDYKEVLYAELQSDGNLYIDNGE